MKKYLFLLGLSVLAFTACKDDEVGPVLKVNSTQAFTSPAGGTSYVLTAAKASEIFANFAWTAADFGFNAAVTYTVEMDIAGKNFAEPVTVGSTSGLSLSTITNEKINTFLFVTKALPGEEAVDVEFRVAANVNADVPTIYSPTIKLNVTPYTIVVVYPKLQVPGSYQSPQWDPTNDNTVIYSVKSDERYEGYVNFPADNSKFKFTKGKAWAVNWGDTGADGSLNPDGADISAGIAGVYKLNVDLNTLTYSSTRTDWGLIGSATPDGWNSDQNMTYNADANKWSITLNLVAGDIKFRANDDWAINFGDDGANKSLEYGGANIAVAAAGNYTIDLLLNQAVYSYKIKKN
ncbi:MAG: SusE domain-containing protein [Bacteroidota bacterium]